MISVAVYPAVPLPGGNSVVTTNVTAGDQTKGSDESALAPSSSSSVDGPVAYEPGALLVTLADDMSAEDALAALQESPQLAGARLDHVVVDNLVKIALPDGLAVGEATEAAIATGAVSAAQPNYRYYLQESNADDAQASNDVVESVAAAIGLTAGSMLDLQAETPNDPYCKKQWYLDSIHAPEAWDIAASASSSQSHPITIAVIDAAFASSHEDLDANVVSRYSPFSQEEALNDSVKEDDIRHGTHAAGIIGAVANNDMGIAGVADNLCKVSLMRVTEADGSMSTDEVVAAYDNLVKNASKLNIRVVSMSLGTGRDTKVEKKVDTALYNAISKARNAGIVTVVAACNKDSNYTPPFYALPADFDNVVSVINVGKAKNADGLKRGSQSNYNKGDQKAKNISAPGERIYSLYESGYGYMGGTSMATPQVAAIFGLMFTAYPSLSPDEAVSLLYSTAHDLSAAKGTSVGWDAQTGFGEADAAAALDKTRPYLSGKTRIKKQGQLNVKVNGTNKVASKWKWSSSDPTIARVTSTGKVIGKKKGQAIITAKKGSKEAMQVVNVVKVSK